VSLPADRPLVCLVTDRVRLGAADEREARRRVVRQVRLAAAAGVHIVHVRERDLAAGELLRLVEECVEAVESSATRVVVNDRLDVALAAGAHGVHLRADSIDVDRARELAPRPLLVGRSIHSPEEAAIDGADYLVFGPVFPTPSKPAGHQPTGIAALQAAVERAAAPILVIGGMTIERLPLVARAGAAGFAAIGLFVRAEEGGDSEWPTLMHAARRVFDTSRTLV
jgi:thiamine-phosphate pyrophosphorylase